MEFHFLFFYNYILNICQKFHNPQRQKLFVLQFYQQTSNTFYYTLYKCKCKYLWLKRTEIRMLQLSTPRDIQKAYNLGCQKVIYYLVVRDLVRDYLLQNKNNNPTPNPNVCRLLKTKPFRPEIFNFPWVFIHSLDWSMF